MKLSFGEKLFVTANYIVLTLVSLLIVLPFWYVFVVSISTYQSFIDSNGLLLFPKSFSLEYYKFLLGENSMIFGAYWNTIRNTVLGVLLALFLTCTCAYVLSEKKIPGRRLLLMIFIVPLFFKGGLIPTYITVKELGIINTNYVLVLIMAFSSFYMIIMKSFFENLPESLKESAEIDGASSFRILWQIVLPLSTPVMASMGLLYMVIYWNDFFNALIYVSDWSKVPVQLVLRTIVLNASLPAEFVETGSKTPPPTVGLQMATIIMVALPMIVVYPFLQRYFEKGITLGAVKG